MFRPALGHCLLQRAGQRVGLFGRLAGLYLAPILYSALSQSPTNPRTPPLPLHSTSTHSECDLALDVFQQLLAEGCAPNLVSLRVAWVWP